MIKAFTEKSLVIVSSRVFVTKDIFVDILKFIDFNERKRPLD